MHMFSKYARGEGWGGGIPVFSVQYGSASAERKVELLSFIQRHGSRYQCLVSFLVQIKKMN